MKKNLLPAIIFIYIIAIATACNTPRYIYSPSAHNVPVLTQKGDSKIGAVYSTNFAGEETRDGYSTDNRSRGIDAQGAVAITDNWAIQASHFYRWEKSEGGPDSVNVKYQRNLTELGIGYYMPLNNKKNVFFQFFVGGGIGKFSFSDRDRFGYNFHEANVSKVYLQPAIIFRSKRSFTNSISVRGSVINYRNIKTSYDPIELEDFYLDNLNNRGKVFIEPSYTASFGLKNVPGLRFELQAGVSLLAARKYVDYRFVNFSAGTWLNIGQLFNKRAE